MPPWRRVEEQFAEGQGLPGRERDSRARYGIRVVRIQCLARRKVEWYRNVCVNRVAGKYVRRGDGRGIGASQSDVSARDRYFEVEAGNGDAAGSAIGQDHVENTSDLAGVSGDSWWFNRQNRRRPSGNAKKNGGEACNENTGGKFHRIPLRERRTGSRADDQIVSGGNCPIAVHIRENIVWSADGGKFQHQVL